MRSLMKSSLFPLAILFTAVLLLQACGGDDPITGPNFDTVPEPYDLTQADTTYTKDGGVEIYVIERGNGPFEVIARDQISVKYTGRTIDGEVFESSFANGNEFPAIITNLRPVSTENQRPQVEGFRRGLLGMVEGEKRTIIVPPSLGYDSSRVGVNGIDLRGDTLRYDVELVGIQ